MLTSSVDGLKKMQHKDWTNVLAAAFCDWTKATQRLLTSSVHCLNYTFPYADIFSCYVTSMFTQKHQMFELFASVLFYMLQNS
jgi:hypothetical protein